jgi:hypothetical protein
LEELCLEILKQKKLLTKGHYIGRELRLVGLFFFDVLSVKFDYEKKHFKLSSGKNYLPDFYIHDFNAYFEVKPSNEDVVTEECEKARFLAKDFNDFNVWLAMGPPSSEKSNILPLSQWGMDIEIEQILAVEENRYKILEDRRDSNIYWLHSELVEGLFHHSLW